MFKTALFVLLGTAVISVYLPLISFKHVQGKDFPFAKNEAPTVRPVVSGKPARVTVPRLKIDLPVVDGIYNPTDRSWSLGKTTAQYATNTTPLNDNSGNTFIYGHNNRHVFGELLNVQPGEEVVVVSDDGKKFYYRYRSSFDVQPHQVEAIKHEGKPILTIQTCVGRYFEQRRMFQFDFIRVET